MSEPFPESALDGAAKRIQPMVRRHVDDVYNAILDSVLDYLIDNAQFNIGQKIATAQRGEKEALAKAAALEAEKTDLLEALQEIMNERWSPAGRSERVSDLARAAIAKAGGAS